MNEDIKRLVEALEEVLPFAHDRGLAGIDGVSRERAVENARQALASITTKETDHDD